MNTISARTAVCLILATCVVGSASASLIYYTAQGDSPGSFSNLYSVQTDTGTITDRGILTGQAYVTDLAFDIAGTLYGVGWSDASASGFSSLFTITPGDGANPAQVNVLTVKSNKMQKDVVAAAMSAAGDLYVASAAGRFQKFVYELAADRWVAETTAWLAAGPSRYDAVGDLAFSADGLILYITIEGGLLGSVDFDVSSGGFGQISVIGPSGYDEITGLVFTGGVLYGTGGSAGGYGPSFLVSLDTGTGAASGAVAISDNVWGASAGPAPIPEATTVSLVVGGAIVLLIQQLSRRRLV